MWFAPNLWWIPIEIIDVNGPHHIPYVTEWNYYFGYYKRSQQCLLNGGWILFQRKVLAWKKSTKLFHSNLISFWIAVFRFKKYFTIASAIHATEFELAVCVCVFPNKIQIDLSVSWMIKIGSSTHLLFLQLVTESSARVLREKLNYVLNLFNEMELNFEQIKCFQCD